MKVDDGDPQKQLDGDVQENERLFHGERTELDGRHGARNMRNCERGKDRLQQFRLV